MATAMSFVQPRVVAILAAGARGPDDGFKTALGPGWEESSVTMGGGCLGLPLRGEIATHFLRRPGAAAPAQVLGSHRAAAVVPMENLLKSVEPSLERGWDLLSAKTRETPEPEDEKTVLAEVAKSGHLPGRESDLVAYSFSILGVGSVVGSA